MLSKRTKSIGTSAVVAFAIGYGFSKFILKSEHKASAKNALILAAFGAAYGYLKNPNIEVTSNASGKKKKEKDVPSPKANTKTPNSWWMDKNGRYHWVNNSGKIVD